MLKFNVFVTAAILLQVVSAIPSETAWKRHQNHLQLISLKIKEICNEAANSVANLETDLVNKRFLLVGGANEFAHDIQNVVYGMQQLAQSAEGEEKKFFQGVSQSLSEAAYSVQQSINSQPGEMKNKIKDQILMVASKAEHLAQHMKEVQRPLKEQDDHIRAVKRIMMDLQITVKKLQTQVSNQNKTIQEIAAQFKGFSYSMNMYTQPIKDDDEYGVFNMADLMQRMSQYMSNMVDKIQKEVYHLHGQPKGVMQKIANEISEQRTVLEKGVNVYGNTQQKAHQLKQRLESVMKNCATEMQNLVQVAGETSVEESQTIKTAISNIIDEAIAVAAIAQSQLEMIKTE